MFWQHLLSPVTQDQPGESRCSCSSWFPGRDVLTGLVASEQLPAGTAAPGSQPLGRLCYLLQPSRGGMEMPAFKTSPQTLLSPQKPPAKCTDRSPAMSVLPASWCIVRAPASARPKCHSSIVSSLTALHFILAQSYKEYAVAGMGKIGLLEDNRGI